LKNRPQGLKPSSFWALYGTAEQAAEKLRMGGEKVDFEGYKTINPPSRIVLRASQLDPFFALCGKLSFSAACEAVPLQSC